MKKLKRNCSVCGSVDGQVLHNQSFVIFENSPLPDNYDIVSCSDCGFTFADTPASQYDYNLYYSILSKYEDSKVSSGSGFNDNDLWRLNRTADFISKYISPEHYIMDLGCANGGQLMIFKNRGYRNLLGVDPSEKCVKNVSLSGIPAILSDIFSEKFREIDQKFDLIILSHVLEHIKDLTSALEIIKSKMQENGLLYIEVPDASRYCDHFVVPFYYFDSEHINHFSPLSLSNLLNLSGFSEIDSSQNTIEINKSIKYPVCYSLFKSGNLDQFEIRKDDVTVKSIMKFLDQSVKEDLNGKFIDALVESQEEIVIWGAGQFTQRILATTNLRECKILGFVDSDHSKQGKKIGEYNVYPPEYIINKEITLLISSALYSDDIVQYALKLNKNIKKHVLK